MLKRLCHFLFLSIFFASCAFSPSITPPTHPTVKPTTLSPVPGNDTTSFLGVPWDDAALFAPGLVKSQREQYSSTKGASIYHIALEIAPDMVNVKGREEVRYTNREKSALNKVEFRLFPNLLGGKMTVSNLTVNGRPAAPVYGLENSLMSVPLTLQQGESCIIGMDFALSVPTDPEKNYGVLASLNNVLTLAHSYPMIPVYDQQGWHAEIPPQWGDLTFTDAAYFVVRVTAPTDAVLIATGRQISNEKADQSQTALFALGPGRDFMLTAAKNYEVQTKQVGETTVNSYAPVEFQKNAGIAAKTASEALNDFSKRYAPYPYTEFDIVATPTLALGIEYPGLVAITNRIYGSGGTFNSTPVEIYLESTVAHETGHQWFYNLVGDDQLNQPWLDESLTQFITWQYFADNYGEKNAEGFKQSLEARWAHIDNAKIPVGQPVAAYDGAQYSAIVYGRGALFFFALRHQMGQEKFNAFLKNYTQKFTWDISTTDALKAQAEKDCGCDLSALFKEWIAP